MQEFTNETFDLDSLPKYEEIVLKSPNPKYWNVIVINLSIILLFIGGGLATIYYFVDDEKPKPIYLVIGYLVFCALLFIVHRLSFKKRGYALREKDIVYKSGIIAETTTIVPLNRIQHVALDQGITSRSYGLATLQIFTAGGQTGHLHIAGIEVERAKNIKEILLRKLDQIENLTENQ